MLIADAAFLGCAALARVAADWAGGAWWPRGDLAVDFLPKLAWWWSRPRWLAGWNPWIYAGFPANADPQIGQLHPFGLLYAMLPPLVAQGTENVLVPFAAMLGMRAWLRALGCTRVGALAGALSYGLGGFVAAHGVHTGPVRAAAALPWALAAIERLRGPCLVAGLALAVAAVIAAGHPQVVVLALLVVVVFAAWRRGRTPAAGAPGGGALVAGLVLGALVAAAQWLPSVPLVASSSRFTHGFPVADADRLGPVELAALIVPFAFGDAAGPVYGHVLPHASTCAATQCSGYPGMLAWLAVLAAVPLLGGDPRARFWMMLAGLGLVLGAGVGDATLQARGVRAAARFLLWWNVAAATLAGLATSALLGDAGAPRQRRLLATALGLGLVVAATGATWPHAWRAAVVAGVALVATTLAATAARPERAASGALLLAVLVVDLLAFASGLPLATSRAAFRAVEAPMRALAAAVPAGPGPAPSRVLVTPGAAGIDWAMRDGVAVVQGYGAIVPAPLAALLEGPGATGYLLGAGAVLDGGLARDASHVLDLLGCATVATTGPQGGPLAAALHARSPGPRWTAAGRTADGGFTLFANRRARPLAWLVERVRVVGAEEALAAVRGEPAPVAFDPAREALAEAPIAGLDGASDAAAPPSDPPAAGSVTVLDWAEDAFALEVGAARPGLLVTSEPDFPGWQASVDGEEAPIHRVNVAFRAVALGPGRHRVVFRYRPLLDRVGLGLSGLAALAVAALFALGARTRPRPSG